MSFFSRAVRLAGIALSAAGLIISVPAAAGEIERSLAPTVTFNRPAVAVVPPVITDAPRPAFASLADAVAAQDGAMADEHLRCLASAVYFESQGEPLAGQLAVAQVILNRTRSGRFASDVCGVITQRGQFGFVRGGAFPTVPASRPAFRTAVAVAKVAMAEAWDQPAPQALYFHGTRERTFHGKRVALIGHHIFYR